MTKIEEPLEKGWLRNVMRDVQIQVEARKLAVAQVQQSANKPQERDAGPQFTTTTS